MCDVISKRPFVKCIIIWNSRCTVLSSTLAGSVDCCPSGLAGGSIDEHGSAELQPEPEGARVLQLPLCDHGGSVEEFPHLQQSVVFKLKNQLNEM